MATSEPASEFPFSLQDGLNLLVLKNLFPYADDVVRTGPGTFFLCFEWLVDRTSFLKYFDIWLVPDFRLVRATQEDCWWEVVVVDAFKVKN